MKKTFLAMLLLGGTVSMFAQTTPQPSTPTTGNGSATSPTTTQPTATQPTTTQPSTTQPATTSPTNGTMSGNTNTTNQGMNTTTTSPTLTSNLNNANGTMNNANGTMSANANWNGVNASTSWTPEVAPTYGWNSYGVWGNSGSLYPTVTAGGFPIPVATDASASMNSSSSNSAYNGTPVSALPANVQTHFGQDFPANASNSYTWNQYGDWFHTYYMNNGRLWQYHYSTRGDGYALALPVIQTYVPENIINSALQKYGSSLYSISMVKTNSGNSAYQVGLLQHGQLTSQYLDDNGASVADVWRVEDSSSMNSTQANAAMDNSGATTNSSSLDNSSNSSSNVSSDASQSATSDANNQAATDANTQASDKGKSKLKIKNADGSETKIKTKNGETKVKHKDGTNSTSNDQQQ